MPRSRRPACGVLLALLGVTPLFNLSPSPFGLTSGLQLAPVPKVYEDGPRISNASRLHVTESVSGQHLRKKIEPEYPPGVEANRIEEDVIFRIIIGKNGKIKEIHLRRGKPALIKAAARALSEWQYEPFM